MKRVTRLNERDMTRLVRRIVNEQQRGMGLKDPKPQQNVLSIRDWLHSLGANPNISGGSWSVRREGDNFPTAPDGGSSGVYLTLKYSNGKVVKIEL